MFYRVVEGRLKVGKAEERKIQEVLQAYQHGLSLVRQFCSHSQPKAGVQRELYKTLRERLGLPAVYANAALRRAFPFTNKRPTLNLYAKAFTLDLTTHPPLLSLRVQDGRVCAAFHTSERNLALLNAHRPQYGELRDECGRFYVRFCLKILAPDPPTDPQHVVGVDLGERYLLATSDMVLYSGTTLQETLLGMLRFAKKTSRRARKAYRKHQHQAELLLRTTVNHFLLSLPPGSLIVLEDLRGIKESAVCPEDRHDLFHMWPYGRARTLILEKAELLGHSVKLVSPAHTSVTCPSCGDIHSRNRRGEEFQCRRCGFQGHADLVAAINLCNRGMPTRAMQPGPVYPLALFVPTTTGVRESPVGGRCNKLPAGRGRGSLELNEKLPVST